MSQYLSLTFGVSLDQEEILTGYFLMNYDVQGFEETSDGLLIVHIFSDLSLIENDTALQQLLSSEKIRLLKIEEIENKDWNAAWEAAMEPVRISNELVITPSWKLEEAKKIHSRYQLIIDPKMSFGTGHHETTRLCLGCIERLDCKNKMVLDIGTGTGALAMYAILRGARHAVGIDTDQWSFANAAENRNQNSFTENEFEIRLGDIERTVQPDEIFDIIFANIHRNILLAIKKEIPKHHKKNGILILSGLLEYDAQEIISAYESSGYALAERVQENEWIALKFEKR
jgi:ribosomal protein L11 methyltransferase